MYYQHTISYQKLVINNPHCAARPRRINTRNSIASNKRGTAAYRIRAQPS